MSKKSIRELAILTVIIFCGYYAYGEYSDIRNWGQKLASFQFIDLASVDDDSKIVTLISATSKRENLVDSKGCWIDLSETRECQGLSKCFIEQGTVLDLYAVENKSSVELKAISMNGKFVAILKCDNNIFYKHEYRLSPQEQYDIFVSLTLPIQEPHLVHAGESYKIKYDVAKVFGTSDSKYFPALSKIAKVEITETTIGTNVTLGK